MSIEGQLHSNLCPGHQAIEKSHFNKIMSHFGYKTLLKMVELICNG